VFPRQSTSILFKGDCFLFDGAETPDPAIPG
jgi:hypothetical protein